MVDDDVWEIDVPDVVTDEGVFEHYINVPKGSKDEEYYLNLAEQLPGQVLVLDNAVMTDGNRLPSFQAVYFLRERCRELAARVRIEREELRRVPPSFYGPALDQLR